MTEQVEPTAFMEYISLYWMIATTYISPGFLVLCIGFCLWMIWQSMKFNYHYYIKHGELVIFVPNKGSDTEYHVQQLCKEKEYDEEYSAWAFTLFLCLIVLIVGQIIAFLWPISIIIFLPMMTVWFLARPKRKRAVFMSKLQGT